jgi:hypothetical protein
LYVPIQATYAMFIDVYDLAPHWVPKLQNQKSLMHSWHTVSSWGRSSAAVVFAYSVDQC